MARTQTCNRRRWPYLAAVVLVVAGLAIAALAHGLVSSVSERSRDTKRAVADRVRDARFASRLEPWNVGFNVNLAIADAQRLLAAGRVDAAYFLLLPYSTSVRGDGLFRQTYQDVLKEKWALDARKAHQQHAKEKKDGALDEKDVFK